MLQTLVPEVNNSLMSRAVDPELSANLYCAGRLSELVSNVVAPAWTDFRNQNACCDDYIWLMRYAKRGEHLKVRWHGHASRKNLWRTALEQAWSSYINELPPPSSGRARLSRPTATPIDEEDSPSADQADRTFLWTNYQRSHVSLGYKPYIDDDMFIELLCRCLGSGTEIVLTLLKSTEGGDSHSSKQVLLLKSIITAFSLEIFSEHERGLYLLYHRDSLLRAARKRKKFINSSEMPVILSRFNDEIKRLGTQADQIANSAAAHWHKCSQVDCGHPFGRWRQCFLSLFDYADSVCRTPTHNIDPFAEMLVFPPMFKALHGLANQIGLDPYNEAFAYHLLVSLTGSDEARQRPVFLRPNL